MLKSVRGRLSVLSFLQFAVWGCYLTCLGQFLGNIGIGSRIALFYSAAGLVSLFMPALAGRLADRRYDATRLLSAFHFLAACFMLGAWYYSHTAAKVEFLPLFALYFLFLCFFMPTISLSNTVIFSILGHTGKSAVEEFPRIRVFGTIGFVVAMWFVNSAYLHDGIFGLTLTESNPMAAFRFQYNDMMLLCASVTGVIVSVYSLSLPSSAATPVTRRPENASSNLIADIISLFRRRNVGLFLIFAILAGVCVQVTNGYATPFITHFSAMPEYAGSGAASNATMLFSISQISEAACILLIPFFMKRFGTRGVITIALVAWSLRFALFGWGNPGDRLWMLVASMLVYGVAFDFFSIAGQIYMEQKAGEAYRGRGQGILMMMSSGIGATFGMIWAGMVVNSLCKWEMHGDMRIFDGDWQTVWLIFAAYALALAAGFLALFKKD